MKLALELLKKEIVRLERSYALTHSNYRAEVKVELVAAREAQAQMINLSKIV